MTLKSFPAKKHDSLNDGSVLLPYWQKKRAQCHVITCKFHIFPNEASKGNVQDHLFMCFYLMACVPPSPCCFAIGQNVVFSAMKISKIFLKVHTQMLMSSTAFKKFSNCLSTFSWNLVLQCFFPALRVILWSLKLSCNLLIKSDYYCLVARLFSAMQTSCWFLDWVRGPKLSHSLTLKLRCLPNILI